MANSVTGLSTQREQQYQERLLLRLASRFEPMYRREIKRAMTELGRYPNNTGKQAEVLANHGQRLNKILTSEYNASFELFGERLLNSFMKSHRKMEVKKEIPATTLYNNQQQGWISINASRKVTQIAGTTEKQAMEIINTYLADAVADGLGERETALLIQKNIAAVGGQLSTLRARTIARTEGHNASQASQDIAARSSELPMTKEWVSSGGERTRETHSDADGQVVSMNDSFTVGGDSLMYPGDPNGSAEETINCRCIVAYIPG